MQSIDELIVGADPGIDRIKEWVDQSENKCELLPPSNTREDVLLSLQVTTRSTLGAIAYETGGILIDDGWLRFLGSGDRRLPRSLSSWNRDPSKSLFLVADDAVGGFFAINGGALGSDVKNMYYWPPDDLVWEPLEIGYTDFFIWSLSSKLAQFYSNLRWESWREEVLKLAGDQCFAFYPFLWTEQGSVGGSHREKVPVLEALDLKIDLLKQMQNA
jgi:hypothetical protein